MGSGAVVRDSQGKVVAASAKPLLGFFPAELGELLALREGLLLAKEFNLTIAWVELDAVNVVARVLNSFPNSVMDPIISDVKALFRAVGVSNCHAIPRSGNGMAHSLASLTFSSKEEFCWFNPELSCWSSVIEVFFLIQKKKKKKREIVAFMPQIFSSSIKYKM
ncbi:hypothetical protein ACOSQ2_019597 [Xanthoceras sorbifolium]